MKKKKLVVMANGSGLKPSLCGPCFLYDAEFDFWRKEKIALHCS